MILQHRQLPLPISKTATGSSNMRQPNQPNNYEQYLKDQHNFLSKIYLTCAPEETCALLLKRLDWSQTCQIDEKGHNTTTTLSYLWPIHSTLKSSVQSLKRWHHVCGQINPKCSIEQAAQIILMHRIQTAYPDLTFKQIAHLTCENLKTCGNNTNQLEACAQQLLVPTANYQPPLPQYVCKFQKYLQKNSPAKGFSFDLQKYQTIDDIKRIVEAYPESIRIMIRTRSICKFDQHFFLQTSKTRGSEFAKVLATLYKWPILNIYCNQFRQRPYEVTEILNEVIEKRMPYIVVLHDMDNLPDNCISTLASIFHYNETSYKSNKNFISIGIGNNFMNLPYSYRGKYCMGIFTLPNENAPYEEPQTNSWWENFKNSSAFWPVITLTTKATIFTIVFLIYKYKSQNK